MTARQESRDTLTILLVEDDRLNQLFLRRLLEKQGYTVAVANNGLEAVEQHRTGTFDCILMDIQMPLMSGVEATQEIRRNEPDGEHIPIIAVTAHTLPGDRQRFLAAGIDDVVGKPVPVPMILEALHRVVQQRLTGEER